MKEYLVSIELSGKQVPVGVLESEGLSEATFRYSDDYLEMPGVRPISISLPLKRGTFSIGETRKFFEGLLPEGFTRRSVAQWMHTSENDYISILHGLGKECLGAVRITETNDISVASYEKLSIDDVKELAAEGATKSAEIVVESHLSLTGASGKVGLYYDTGTGSWYLPRGTAPSTHIVKQSHIRLGGIVVNEQMSLLTAKKCGLVTVNNFIINVGTGKDGEVLLASERYDRTFEKTNQIINGMKVPLRLHQEDFAQALGIASDEKYEKPAERHMFRMLELLRHYSSDPIADQLKLWDIIVFNWLIGNTDAHVKNFALIYSADMRGLRLAPAYDILSTVVYPSSTRDMAFAINGIRNLDSISRDVFRKAAREVGIGERMAMSHFDKICESFPQALDESATELSELGFADCKTIKDKILLSGGIRNI